MKKVDGVIVVTRLGKSTRTLIQQLHRQLENLGAPVLGVVINGTESDGYGYGYGYGHAPAASENGASSAAPDDHEGKPVGAGRTR